MWKQFVETECGEHHVEKDDKEKERMSCVKKWYEDNSILPPLVVKPSVLRRFSDIEFRHTHWVEGSSKMLTLRELAQLAVANALQLGKPHENDMMTVQYDWYGKANLGALVKLLETCQKHSLIIHNIRSCYAICFLRPRQQEDTIWLYCAVHAVRAAVEMSALVGTRVAYVSLLAVRLFDGFKCIKDFRFDLPVPFSVTELYSYVEIRTTMRECLVALDKNRRDREDVDDDDENVEDVDDLMDAVFALESC
jgi:hypothetical protein